MTDPSCTYAVVDMSQKKKNRPLAKKEAESAYYSVPPEYSLVTYDPDSKELPATAVTATNEDYRKLEKSATASSRNPEPVSTTFAASVRDKIVQLTQFLSDKKSRKLVFCAIAVAIISFAIIIFSCIGALFTEIGKLESKIEAQQILSDDNSRNQTMLAQQASNISLLIAEQDRWNQELHVNLTQISRQVFEGVAQQLMNQQNILNTNLTELQFFFEDRLSENLQETGQSVNITLEIIYAMMEAFNQSLTEINTELEAVRSELQTLRDIHPGTSKKNPASSCAALPPSSPSGYYWVRASNGSAVRVYCDMTLECGNITGGWMRVAELDMTNDTQECPIGLEERTYSGLRTCERRDTQAGCSSIEYSTYNIQYSKVCGRVNGYQIGDINAFGSTPSNEIDSVYVDGVSLTHGSPKRHIWTFGASRDTTQNDCPCNRLNTFVEDHYFCDTASDNSGSIGGQFFSNPLWDGSNCIAPHGCCTFNTPPWFYRSLSQSTTDDIEMRLCRDEPCCGENVAIQIVELYVL